MQRLGVLGWPVAHSLSPAMHNAALRHLGLSDWHYQKLPVPPMAFAETVKALPAAGFRGANVTIPHKEAALQLADTATDLARRIGAANTLTFADGAIHADNTDAPGLLQALGDPAPRSALVLGAGGSARAAIVSLRDAGTDVSVLARTPERVADLGVRTVSEPAPAEALINCTPIGLHDDEVPLDPAGYELVVDFAYKPHGTELIRRATGRTVDGLEILVRQGGLALERWTDAPAPLDVMRRAVQ